MQGLFNTFSSLTTPQKKVRRTPKQLSPLDSSAFDPANCTVLPLPDHVLRWQDPARSQFAVVVENVLTPEECRQWIEGSESHHYETATVNMGLTQQVLTDVRNSDRAIIDDVDRANELWERVKHFIPMDMTIRGMKPAYLNERLRFLRYDVGQYFAPHMDGHFIYPVGHPQHPDTSFLTLQVYLTEDFEGGTTRFFADCSERTYFDVVPKIGSILIFEHRLYHAGEAVSRGMKYAIRTDVMFSRDKGAEERDEEATEIEH